MVMFIVAMTIQMYLPIKSIHAKRKTSIVFKQFRTELNLTFLCSGATLTSLHLTMGIFESGYLQLVNGEHFAVILSSC